jgi:hypothetical protein
MEPLSEVSDNTRPDGERGKRVEFWKVAEDAGDEDGMS